jgi:predicted permease
MGTNLRDLSLRLRALFARRRVERELDEELAFHLERETQKHIAAGLSPGEARTRARARFGPVPLAADACRDARGVGFVDDLIRDVLYAFRTFRRAPLAALTVVATVALGLGLVAVVFTVYNFLMLRVDAVRSPEELFAVKLERPAGPGADEEAVSFARPDYEAMHRETGVFADIVAMLDGGPPYIDDRLGRPILVTGNFFQMLGVQAALGRPLLPDDDEPLEGRRVIVLSHIGWRKLFQGDRGVIGRRVTISGAPYEIVGVMPDGFRGLNLTPPDYWLPLALAGQFDYASTPLEGAALEVIGRLKPGLSSEAAAAALSAWASGRVELKTAAMRPIHASLSPRQGTLSSKGFGIVFAPLFFAFGLILMIGCANVANLLLARGVSRQREIGTRLSLGASRRRIVRQLLTESLILSLVAAACGVAVTQLFLDSVIHAVITTLPPEIARLVSQFNVTVPTADWRVLMFLTAGAVVSTALFGLAPALQATRLDLVRTMRGEVTRDARPRRARHALIVVQVGASALLLICAAVFLRGAAAATRDPGVRTSDTVMVNPDDESKRGALVQLLMADPMVAAIAASSRSTRGVVETTGSSSRVAVDQMAVSSDYFNVLGLALVSGRAFTPAERTADAGVAVVSDAVARQLWPDGDGVGQMVRFKGPQPAALPGEARSPDVERTLMVVGVVRDPGASSGMSFRGVYLPAGPESPGTNLMLRVRGNLEQARVALLQRLPGLDGGFGVMTLRTIVGMQAYLLQIAFCITVVLGGLALVLTVSGLFSVLSYVVEQQSKEIGVRIALGAATKNVVRLILLQSVRPVGIGLVAGGGLAAAVAIVLTATPLAAEIGDTVDVRDPVAYVASLLVIVTVCVLAVSVPALRAARIDPIATLRKD